MSEYLPFLFYPFLATLILIGIHVYFGLHIIKRGIIFVDLALAQIAAFGITIGLLLEYKPDSVISYLLSLGFALIGSLIFTYTRHTKSKIPQEAIIGIVYAVSSAAAILAVSHSPEGSEHIKHLLVGSILTVTPEVIFKTSIIYALVGLFHWYFRNQILALSFNSKNKTSKTDVKYKNLWEFLFFASFAIVVTSSVKICGVLLVFIFLVVPSVFGAVISDKISHRLIIGWLFGIIGSALGILISFWIDTPTGATIVVTFGILLLLVIPIKYIISVK